MVAQVILWATIFYWYDYSMDKIHRVFDISEASKSEKDELKLALEVALSEVLVEAQNMIERGEFHGCAYVHLEIAAAEMQRQYPCEDCSEEIPKDRKLQ